MPNTLPDFIRRAPVLAASLTLLVASATCNALFGFTLATTTVEAVVLVGASIAADVLKSFAPIALRRAVQSRDVLTAFASLCLIAVTAVYSCLAALGFAASVRDTNTAERQAAIDTAARTQQHLKAARSELVGLGPVRPVKSLAAQILAIETRPGIMIAGAPCGGRWDGPITREHCPIRAELLVELGKAERASELHKIIGRSEALLDQAGSVPVAADPQAEALGAYLAVLGWTTTTDQLRPWLVGVVVLLVELGSLFGLFIATSGNQVRTTQETAQGQPMAQSQIDPEPELDQSEPSLRANVEQAVLDLVQRQGGSVRRSERGLAQLIGTSRSTARRALNSLAAAGVIAIAAGASGTEIRMLA